MTVTRTIVGLSLLGLAMSGCGYTQGYQSGSLYRADVQTVAVPIFRNKTFRPGVEIPLTGAVVVQLESHSPYKVVPRERADTILECEITDVDVEVATRDYRTALPRQQTLGLTVDVVWKDLRSGRILLERRGFSQTAAYYPPLGEGPFAGSQQAIEKLALAIVQEMQAEW